jgi:hypothetical protein
MAAFASFFRRIAKFLGKLFHSRTDNITNYPNIGHIGDIKIHIHRMDENTLRSLIARRHFFPASHPDGRDSSRISEEG